MLVYQRVIFNSGVKMRVSEDLDGQAFRPEFFMTKWHHFLWGPNSSKTPEIRLAATCSNSVCWLLQSIFNTHHALFQIGYLFCPVLNEFLRCDVTTCVQIVQGFQKNLVLKQDFKARNWSNCSVQVKMTWDQLPTATDTTILRQIPGSDPVTAPPWRSMFASLGPPDQHQAPRRNWPSWWRLRWSNVGWFGYRFLQFFFHHTTDNYCGQ